MRQFILLILILSLISCRQTKSSNILVTNDLKYSAYVWHFNKPADSFQFYLMHYINIDSNGDFTLMRHDEWLGQPKFFEGHINKAVMELINSTFQDDNFKSHYTWNPNDGIYDGYSYCFEYDNAANNKNKKIQFIPKKCPLQLRELALVLDTLIYETKTQEIDTLDIQSYGQQLEQIWIDENGGRIPKPNKAPLIKFKPPTLEKR